MALLDFVCGRVGIRVKVLVVEDSERLRRALGEGLRRSGFVVDLTCDGRQGLEYANASEYDVIVLDIMMPRLDGLTLLKRLRAAHNQAQVLILSAKDLIEDRVQGLELGADDYLVKPFAFEELVARIKSLGRRRHDVKTPCIEIGDVTVDSGKRQVKVRSKRMPLSLTPAEYNLLEYLSVRRGRVVPKGQLKDWLSTADSEAVSNVVEVLVSNLRKKLTAAGVNQLIKTKRGFGYYID